MLSACERSKEHKNRQWSICARDPLYWLNVFGYIFEPRTKSALPFITYGIQDIAILKMNASIGECDVILDKSRDMGASWCALALLTWHWLFSPDDCKFLLASRKRELVDSLGNPDTLFSKVDYLLKWLPNWMKPKDHDRKLYHMLNPWNGSTIDGDATTGDLGRAGRRLVVLMDEAAFFPIEEGYRAESSTRSTTATRWWISTPNGASGVFYDLVSQDYSEEAVRITMHWSSHPVKRRGLYTTNPNGSLKIIDENYNYPPNYQFILDGRNRSPWYDKECRRTPDPRSIAQELDIDYIGSAVRAFPSHIVQTAIVRDAKAPFDRGDFRIDTHSGEFCGFDRDPGGRLRLWCHLDALLRPPEDNYVIGCDVALGVRDSAGRGASNSVAQVYKRDTGEKYATFTAPGLDPKTFAKHVHALCLWFRSKSNTPAYLIWERNGPGRLFGDEIHRLSFSNIYYHRLGSEVFRPGTVTRISGWVATKDSKVSLLGEYGRAVGTGEVCNRCRISIEEMKYFVILPNGSWAHQGSQRSDPSGARENHGDRCTADAVAWHAIRLYREKHQNLDDRPEIKPGSLAWRRQLAEIEDRKAKEGTW